LPNAVRARFDGNNLASGVVVLGALFGSLIEVIINIKGTSLVVSNVFGVDPRLAAIIGLVVVLIYSMLGGLWASVTTSALSTLLHTVPSCRTPSRDVGPF
jgi:urea-proton symporter